MWTRIDINNTPDSLRIDFAPAVGRHILAWLVMVGAALGVYVVLDLGEIGPASLVLSAVVILLGAVLRMGLRARSSLDLSVDGVSVLRRGVPPQVVPLNHVASFGVGRTGLGDGVPGHHLIIQSRSHQAESLRVGAGASPEGLQHLADTLTERLDRLRAI